jgi:hypothetical protein
VFRVSQIICLKTNGFADDRIKLKKQIMKTIGKYYWILIVSFFILSLPAKAQQSTSGAKQLEMEKKNEVKRERQRRADVKDAEKTQEKGDEKPKYKAIVKKRRNASKPTDKKEDKKEKEFE